MGLKDKYSLDDMDKIPKIEDQAPSGKIHFKMAESFVGVLVYVSVTYALFVPYIKSIYLTLKFRHPGRGKDGWSLPALENEQDKV